LLPLFSFPTFAKGRIGIEKKREEAKGRIGI